MALSLNLVLWMGSRGLSARWAGVPPVPSQAGAAAMALGDLEFSYRSGALTLQHLGDGGGRTTPLKDYDYTKVGAWLSLLHGLDPASEHVPFVAAFYFGSLRDHPEKIAVLVNYLAKIGQNPAGEKWRWLAEASFLARHRMNNLDLALDIAYKLSKMRPANGKQLPSWAREYPAFILEAQGEKAAAKQMMLSMLATEENPNEINFIKNYLIHQLGVDRQEIEMFLQKKE